VRRQPEAEGDTLREEHFGLEWTRADKTKVTIDMEAGAIGFVQMEAENLNAEVLDDCVYNIADDGKFECFSRAVLFLERSWYRCGGGREGVWQG